MAERPTVFISYARKDGEVFATKLRKRLETEHPEISLWQDRTRMEGWLVATDHRGIRQGALSGSCHDASGYAIYNLPEGMALCTTTRALCISREGCRRHRV